MTEERRSVTAGSRTAAEGGIGDADFGRLGEAGDLYLRRVRRAATRVLGDSPLGREVQELCDEHAEARRGILRDRSAGWTVIAVVGATGQGKSWLIRNLIRRSSAASVIRSGNDADEATEQLTWVGPRPPADLDSRFERFVFCEASKMEPIGIPYLLLDAPGSTDDRRGIAAVAGRSLALASVLIVVARRDQLRCDAICQLARGGEGTLIVPVINAVRRHDEALATESDSLVARLREWAPRSVVVPPVVIQDFEVGDADETTVGGRAAEMVAERLRDELGQSWEGDRRRSTRLSALDDRFHAALHGVLSDHLPGLTDSVRRLNREALALPGEVARSLIGPRGSIRAAIRSRLRLGFLCETAAIWFPYRSLLGLLNLTNGAWDRLLLSFSGSLPSLVGAIWSGAQNVAQGRALETDIREGLRRRGAAAVADRLGPLASRFRDELATLRRDAKAGGQGSVIGQGPFPGQPQRPGGGWATPVEGESGAEPDASARLAYLAGLDALQEVSERIFDEEIERVAAGRGVALGFALAGTAVFWALLSGPIVALYRTYFGASLFAYQAAGGLERFPHPTASMMLTSLILSLLPVAILAMVALSLAQSRRRVERAEERIRGSHATAIETLRREGVLRLCWDDPLLADAEFLLSAGAGTDWGEEG